MLLDLQTHSKGIMGIASTMKSWSQQLTPYFIYLLFVATLGPLLFGYHLVCPSLMIPSITSMTTATKILILSVDRLSSMLLKKSLLVTKALEWWTSPHCRPPTCRNASPWM